eukprot:CAMPEP_0197576396 /NCGR_PEP_ID=MMETSP1326-20131121/1433_1 /TAXON_ID=1155430 /ORGANISM="Genus nov. species nov., Strain RCC2288" /LENGTH=566 /DNA_ID=CAMNT_0043139305 /DNA_START=135 /DNA_END=1832 /DNA_ORIENTATION=+
MRPRPPTAPAPGGSVGTDDLYMPGRLSSGGRRGAPPPLRREDTLSSNGSPKERKKFNLPELRDLRSSNRELQGEISALAQTPRSDQVVQANVREREDAVVTLRVTYNTLRERALARLRHIERLKADWEVMSEVRDSIDFNADADAAVTLRGVPSPDDIQRTLDALNNASQGQASPMVGAGGNLLTMSTSELRATQEEAARRLQSVELSLTIAKLTQSTLDHMIKRFTEERLGEETRYVQVKESIGAIVRQEKEHVLQVKMVGHDEDVARSTIAALQEQLSRVTGKRKELVNTEKGKMTIKAGLQDYVNYRTQERLQIATSVAGDLNAAEEEVLRNTSHASDARQAVLVMESAHMENLEKAFTQIAERTGDDDVDSFVNRFLALIEIGKQADGGKETTEIRANDVRRELGAFQKQLKEMQDGGGLNFSIRRNEFNTLEGQVDDKDKQYIVFQSAYSEANGRLVHLKAGISALAGQLEPISATTHTTTDKGDVLAVAEVRVSSVADPTIHQLHFIEQCLDRMCAAVEKQQQTRASGLPKTAPATNRSSMTRRVALVAALEEEEEEEGT